MEYVEASIGFVGPTDCTLVLVDSLHPRAKEYGIEGDGWRAVDQACWKHWRKTGIDGPKYPVRADEGTKLYEALHEIYLSFCPDDEY